jgi:hypothetical protein
VEDYLSRKVTVQVSDGVLKQLFKELCVWEKIHKGILTTIPLAPRQSTTYPDGISRILLHFDEKRNHIASTHRIMNETTGVILHWDEKGMKLNDVWLERQ